MKQENILVENTLGGDMESFSLLVQLYQGRLFNFLLKLTNSREDAEELLQDVFMKAFQYLYKYDSKWTFATWIYRIAANVYKTDYSRKKRQIDSSSTVNIPEELFKISCNPEKELEDKESYLEVVKLFACINSEQRMAILLHHVQGFTYKEIGRILGISAEAAKMKVQRGKQVLSERYYSLRKGGI